jgi:hypothetical protein
MHQIAHFTCKCTSVHAVHPVHPVHPVHIVHPAHLTAIHFQKCTRVHTLQICALCAPCATSPPYVLQSHCSFIVHQTCVHDQSGMIKVHTLQWHDQSAHFCALCALVLLVHLIAIFFWKCTRVHTLQICAPFSIFSVQDSAPILYNVHFCALFYRCVLKTVPLYIRCITR